MQPLPLKKVLSPKRDPGHGHVHYHPLTDEQVVRNAWDRQWLNIANLVAGVFHTASFIAALVLSIVYQDRVFRGTITTTTTRANLVPQLDVLGRYPISWTILPFPIITALFHFALALIPALRDHVHRISLHQGERCKAGWNWVRWVEYSITASFMTWTIAQLSGVTDLATLFCFVALNAMMQLAGGLGHEWVNKGWSRASDHSASWWLFALGFLPFATIWAIVFGYFVVQAREESAPAFVYVAIVGMFVLFSSFVVPILLRYTRWTRWLGSDLSYELSWIALSFVAKAALDWTLVIGSITR